MGYGPKQVFSCGIASAASTSSFIDLGDKSFTKIAVNASTMSTGAALTVYGCPTSSGTYLAVQERINTASVQYQSLVIPTSTSGSWAVLDCPPFRYLKFAASATVTDGAVNITVMGAD